MVDTSWSLSSIRTSWVGQSASQTGTPHYLLHLTSGRYLTCGHVYCVWYLRRACGHREWHVKPKYRTETHPSFQRSLIGQWDWKNFNICYTSQADMWRIPQSGMWSPHCGQKSHANHRTEFLPQSSKQFSSTVGYKRKKRQVTPVWWPDLHLFLAACGRKDKLHQNDG